MSASDGGDDDDDADEWPRLRRHLELTDGSYVGYIIGDLRMRALLRARVEELVRSRGQRLVLVDPRTPAELTVVTESLINVRDPALLWLEPRADPERGLDLGAHEIDRAWASAWVDLANRLNEHRETLRRSGHPLLVAIDPATKQVIREHAPDLWSTRAIVVEEERSAPRQQQQRHPGARVFLSFAQDDARLAQRLARALQQRGLVVSLDPWDAARGADWARDLGARLARAEGALILLSNALLARPWARPELSLLARHAGTQPLIPVLHDIQDLRGVPPELLGGLQIDLRGQEGPSFERLVDRLADQLSPSAPRPAMSSPVYRWLHLSDLHLSASADPRFWGVLDSFEESLRAWLPRVGAPIDLLLLTGDLAAQGRPDDYERVDAFLTRLRDLLARLTGVVPLIVPVPGNHDLQRPDPRALRQYRVLDALYPHKLADSASLDEDVAFLRQQLWEERNPDLIADLFAAYTAWLDRSVLPALRAAPHVGLHRSFFPGDLTVTLDLPGRFPLALVCLNSAWSQYKSGEFAGRLHLPVEQFLAALPKAAPGGSPLDLFRQARRALLLQHHPRRWLSERARQDFESELYPPRRFTAALFGAMHEPEAVNEARAGGGSRVYFQAPSFFGLENYGGAKESRIFGYTFGQLARDGEVRLWPLRAQRKGDGVWAFDRDPLFHWSDNDLGGVLLRPADPEPPPTSTPGPRPVLPRDLDLAAYCRVVRDETCYIRLDGIAAAAKALSYPIERLYTRLRTHARHEDLRRDLVDLAELLPRHHRLLIEGQPGSGKTTFLKLAASVLARDFLDEPCPEGPSWRAVHLGRGVARTLPVFLKLSRLATAPSDTRKGAARLLDHLAEETRPRTGDTDDEARARREAWDQRLVRGEATLLLDGLDEVGDPALRERVFAALQDILRAWPKCQVVVTSRPLAVEPLKALGFAHASVAAFGPDEVRAYALRWVHAYFETDSDQASGTTEEAYATKLLEALRSRQELRRLASAPVMLTCLCVVYSHGGGLPEGRAELYRDTIRWLIAAREKVREERGYSGVRVQEALSVLALEMMGGANAPKHRELGFSDAAAIVAAIVRGPRFEQGSAAERDDALRAWLRFECEYSGVIEEVGQGQLQFKHLTFQEYLAAAQLAASERDEWWAFVKARLLDLQWRETIELFPGCLLDRERGATSGADFLVNQVHKLWPKEPPLLRAARITAVTGRFAPAFRCAKYQLPKERAERDAELRAEAEAIFTREGAAKIEETLRVAAAEAIGVAGDKRIAAGTFERNLITVKGHRVRLGKYLVTVEEYARFVEDGGYQREEFWVDEEGWSFRTRYGWEAPNNWEEQLQTPNRPVVRVSWFEAMAYCRWLSAEHPDLRVRLPSEAEWMAVASPDGRRFPWGKEQPDDTRANFGGRVNAATPVGIYPAGDGAYGHADLAGNVWEWSLDVASSVEFTEKQFGRPRLLCGGCYWDGAEGLAAAVRYGFWSDYRGDGVGFRVVAEPASP